MRRILTAALTMLAAVISLAIPAQPAAADDPGTTFYSYPAQGYQVESCITPNRAGVLGQFGAWGFYIDGCTVKASCPHYVSWCKVTGRGQIYTQTAAGHRVTLNSRVRLYDSTNTVVAWLDTSCEGINSCAPAAKTITWMLPGQAASEQCNGVRQNAPNMAHVECDVIIEYMY